MNWEDLLKSKGFVEIVGGVWYRDGVAVAGRCPHGLYQFSLLNISESDLYCIRDRFIPLGDMDIPPIIVEKSERHYESDDEVFYRLLDRKIGKVKVRDILDLDDDPAPTFTERMVAARWIPLNPGENAFRRNDHRVQAILWNTGYHTMHDYVVNLHREDEKDHLMATETVKAESAQDALDAFMKMPFGDVTYGDFCGVKP